MIPTNIALSLPIVAYLGVFTIMLAAHLWHVRKMMAARRGEITKRCGELEQDALQRLYHAYQTTSETVRLQIALKMMAEDMCFLDERWETPEEYATFYMQSAYHLVRESEEWGKKFEGIKHTIPIEPTDD